MSVQIAKSIWDAWCEGSSYSATHCDRAVYDLEITQSRGLSGCRAWRAPIPMERKDLLAKDKVKTGSFWSAVRLAKRAVDSVGQRCSSEDLGYEICLVLTVSHAALSETWTWAADRRRATRAGAFFDLGPGEPPGSNAAAMIRCSRFILALRFVLRLHHAQSPERPAVPPQARMRLIGSCHTRLKSMTPCYLGCMSIGSPPNIIYLFEETLVACKPCLYQANP